MSKGKNRKTELQYNANPYPNYTKIFKEVKSIDLRHLKALLCKDAGINIDGVGREDWKFFFALSWV